MAISGAHETYKRISSLVSSQFPEFIRSDGPKFVSFLQAYYEFLERDGGAVSVGRSLKDYQDVDRTIDSFVEYFRREFMTSIPKSTLADKRLLAKYIREFYRTRGTQESYRFLFRALYDREIEFYYPGDDILRASDGRWVKETVLRVAKPFSTAPTAMDGATVTGLTSGARGRVQGVIELTLSGVQTFELTLEAVTGTFEDGETIRDDQGRTATITNSSGSLADIVLGSSRGAYHRVGDVLTITGPGATAANATITGTTDQSALTFKLVNPGSGYRIANTRIVIDNTGTGGSGASFSIFSVSNATNVSINSDKISPLRNVPINTGATFVSTGANSAAVSANLASANVSSVLSAVLSFSNVSTGSIDTIELTNPGYGYTSMPRITLIDDAIADVAVVAPYYGGFKGRNAVVVANSAYGAITGIRVNSRGANFNKNEQLTVTNLALGNTLVTSTAADKFGTSHTLRRRSAYAPVVTAEVSGVSNLPGRYIDTRGFLSWNNRLQDGDFYQEYSYVVKVAELVDKYRDVVKRVLHPAGSKMFGFYEIASTVDPGATFSVTRYEDIEDSFVLWGANTGLYGNVYVSATFANSTITPYAGVGVGVYGNVYAGVFDGSARLVRSIKGTAQFANGLLKATTGAISVTGSGSLIRVTPVSAAQNTTIYQINAIFSNTIFTLRTPYVPVTTNAYFKYLP